MSRYNKHRKCTPSTNVSVLKCSIRHRHLVFYRSCDLCSIMMDLLAPCTSLITVPYSWCLRRFKWWLQIGFCSKWAPQHSNTFSGVQPEEYLGLTWPQFVFKFCWFRMSFNIGPVKLMESNLIHYWDKRSTCLLNRHCQIFTQPALLGNIKSCTFFCNYCPHCCQRFSHCYCWHFSVTYS